MLLLLALVLPPTFIVPFFYKGIKMTNFSILPSEA